MALGDPIFTLDGGFNCVGIFWSNLDNGTIKSCFRIGKHWFLGISKKLSCKCLSSGTSWLFFLNAQKWNVSNPNATFNGTTVTGISKAAQNNWTPHLKWILSELQHLFTIFFFLKTNCCSLGVSPSHSCSAFGQALHTQA